jgi:hypothetical protein
MDPIPLWTTPSLTTSFDNSINSVITSHLLGTPCWVEDDKGTRWCIYDPIIFFRPTWGRSNSYPKKTLTVSRSGFEWHTKNLLESLTTVLSRKSERTRHPNGDGHVIFNGVRNGFAQENGLNKFWTTSRSVKIECLRTSLKQEQRVDAKASQILISNKGSWVGRNRVSLLHSSQSPLTGRTTSRFRTTPLKSTALTVGQKKSAWRYMRPWLPAWYSTILW